MEYIGSLQHPTAIVGDKGMREIKEGKAMRSKGEESLLPGQGTEAVISAQLPAEMQPDLLQRSKVLNKSNSTAPLCVNTHGNLCSHQAQRAGENQLLTGGTDHQNTSWSRMSKQTSGRVMECDWKMLREKLTSSEQESE